MKQSPAFRLWEKARNMKAALNEKGHRAYIVQSGWDFFVRCQCARCK